MIGNELRCPPFLNMTLNGGRKAPEEDKKMVGKEYNMLKKKGKEKYTISRRSKQELLLDLSFKIQ